MRKVWIFLVSLLVLSCLPASALTTAEEKNLVGVWVLEGMSESLKGERIPDGALYDFRADGTLHYQMSGFKQSGAYKIQGKKITTEAMGNYKVISIGREEMVLHYGGYLFFKRRK